MWQSRAASGPSANTHEEKESSNVSWSRQRAAVVLINNLLFVRISAAVLPGLKGRNFLDKEDENS